MATADSTALLTLRGLACALGGITAGLLLAGHVWSRLQADTATATSLLFPLLAALLACCALLVDSAAHTPTPSSQSDIEWLGWLVVRLVRENRKTLYTTAASLIIALRPFSFGLLTPRTEVLKAEERRLLLERLRSGSGSGSSLAAAGLSGWKGASPTKEYAGWVAEREREGEDSDVEDNDGDGGLGLGGGVDGVTPVGPLDTDALILELTRLQFGTAVLAGCSFFLTVLELLCA